MWEGVYHVVPTPTDAHASIVLRARPAGRTCATTAAIVVEVLSPDDETFAELGFYAARGVEEVVVADPAGRRMRIWQSRGGAHDESGRSDVLEVTGDELAQQVDGP